MTPDASSNTRHCSVLDTDSDTVPHGVIGRRGRLCIPQWHKDAEGEDQPGARPCCAVTPGTPGASVGFWKTHPHEKHSC